jgi:hypothetical protein
LVGISRQAVYDNLKKGEVKAAIDQGLADARKHVSDKIVGNSDLYISELSKIALTSKDEKVRANCLQYLLDHTIGKATTKIESTSSSPEDNSVEDIDSILAELEIEDEDNIVPLPKAK